MCSPPSRQQLKGVYLLRQLVVNLFTVVVHHPRLSHRQEHHHVGGYQDKHKEPVPADAHERMSIQIPFPIVVNASR